MTRITAVLVVLGLALPLAAGADQLELATGERVDGKDVRASPDHVTIQVDGRTLIVERSAVRAIHLGPAPAPCR